MSECAQPGRRFRNAKDLGKLDAGSGILRLERVQYCNLATFSSATFEEAPCDNNLTYFRRESTILALGVTA